MRAILSTVCFALLFQSSPRLFAQERERTRQSAVIELITESWKFDSKQPAVSMLDAQTLQAKFATPKDKTAGFTVKFKVDVK